MKDLEFSQRVSSFFAIALYDERITTSHICIYMALCAVHVSSGMENPFLISRSRIMQSCKILGNATYHKCMREMHSFGYIRYVPSYHPVMGSLVTLNDFSSLLNV